MSGDLPRPIKGDSLHHPHAFTSSNNNNTGQYYSPYAFSSPVGHHPFSQPSSSTSSLTAPTRQEFAVPSLPQRALVPQNLGQLGTGSTSASSSTSSLSTVASKRGRRPYAGERHDAIWSPEVQEAFLQAARSIPNNGKNWIMRDGRQYGRNALIAEEIYRLTGQQRTRQQISSHIQVLKKVHADDPMMMKILNGQLEELQPSATARPAAPSSSTPPTNRFGSNSTSPPAVRPEDPGSSASPPPMPNMEPIENLMDGQSFMSVIRSSAPGSIASDGSLPGTPQSPPSTSHSDSKKDSVQIAELIPRSDIPPNIPISRVLTEPLVADRPQMVHPRAWRGERLAYLTAITIWAEKTLKDQGVRSRPTTTHVFAQMHSATCPLEPLHPDMEDIVKQIQPGTCMHAEIGISLPPPGADVGKIRSTLVIEAMREFDGYGLTDAFNAKGERFMSAHTNVFPTGREAREKYSWIYEIPYAPEVWRKVLKESPESLHGMRLVQKYVRSLAGGNRDGDLNVPLLVVHDIKIVPAGEPGYSRIRHVDLTGEQAKHDALGVSVVAADDDSDGSGPMDEDGDMDMDDNSKRDKPNLSVAIPPAAEDVTLLRTRANQLANPGNLGSQPVTPFEQLVHTPQHPPPFAERQEARRGWWAPTPIEVHDDGKISLEDQMNGILGHALGDGGNRMSWLTRDALAAGTPTLSDFAGRDQQGLDGPVRIEDTNSYFHMP